MGFLDTWLGNDAADTANAAARDTYSKQQKFIGDLISYGDTLPDVFKQLYGQYANTGAIANNQLQQLLSNPSSLSSLPGYQFALGQGLQGVDRSAGARGMINSGAHDKAVTQYATGLADQTYGNQLQRLMGGAGVGLAGTGGMAQGVQDQLGTRNTAFGGQMQSAGTIGQGMVAGANAQAAGAQNVMNLASNVLGRFLPTGGFNFGSGSGRASSFGGGYGFGG